MNPNQAAGAFSRRNLLKGGLTGAALLTLGGVGLALRPSRLRPAPASGLRVLTLTEYSVLAAIADRMLPQAAEADGKTWLYDVPGADRIDVALAADRLLEAAEPDAVQGAKLGLALIESGLAGALFFERTTPFTQLSPDAQDRALLSFRDSRVALRRTLYRSFAGLTGSLYYGDPRTFASVGYPGPPDPSALRAAYSEQLVDYMALRRKPV